MHLPTAIDNSDPSKRQAANGSLMAIVPFSPGLIVRACPWRLADRLSRKFRENSDGGISDKQTDDEPNKFCRCVPLPEQCPRAVAFLLLMQSNRDPLQTLKANVVLRPRQRQENC